jgi:hypothetical protein
MGIVQIITDSPGQINFPNLRRVKIISTDNLSTVTASGYLNPVSLQGFVIYNTDIISLWHNATASVGEIVTNPGIFHEFIPTIINGVITLQLYSSQLINFDVTVTAAALANAGKVILVASQGLQQYKVRRLQLNSGGTNFSGGGGDRLGQVSDGTTVYSVIPAADLQTLVNAQWGATALPNPASAAIDTSTAAGANLYFAYSGGTTDYTTGSLVISGEAQRVA